MIKEYLKAVTNILFPPICFTCSKDIKTGILCAACKDKIKFISPPLCKGCAKEIRFFPHKTFKSGNFFCKTCRSKIIYHDRLICCLHYQEPIKTLIHLLKYQNYDYLIDFLANLAISYISKIGIKGNNYHFMTVVPSHHLRLREREYNQSLLLAKKLSVFLKIPLKRDIIFCKENRPHQTRLSKQQRMSNIEGNFYVRDSLKSKRIILVDDIITTGSTVLECAKALKEKEAASVTVIALAKA